MTEIGVTSGAIIAGGWAGRKLLGPLFDEMADDWRERYSIRRARNLARIGRNAELKLGAKIDEAGNVPPRVAVQVLDEGSWCDSEVMAEYFGGILAASRNADANDDRGAVWASLVSRLSTYDTYIHYLFYDAFRRLYLGRKLDSLFLEHVRSSCVVYLPAMPTLAAMGLETSTSVYWRVVIPALNALVREGLIGPMLSFGAQEFMRRPDQAPGAPDGGFLTVPSPAGIELFMWAHGQAPSSPNSIVDRDTIVKAVEDLKSVDGAQAVDEMRKVAANAAEPMGSS